MATQHFEMVIRANPNQPVQEIANIIGLFIQQWPGSEELILNGVRTEIDKALEQIAASKTEPKSTPGPPAEIRRKRKKKR